MASSLSGIFPALTTPFEDGNLSVPRLKSNLEKFNTVDLTGYLVLGSTGESVLMDERERLSALNTVRSSASTGKIIIAGTGMPSTRSTIAFTNLAAEEGADYGLVVTPFFYKGQMTAENLEIYYREVAEKSKIPIILYNVPKFTGLDLPLATVLSLADHPNVAGLKDSSGNMSQLGEVIKACPRDFNVLVGHGGVLFEALALGAKGGILALTNFAPAETVEIFKQVRAGDYGNARKMQLRLVTANQKIVGGYGIAGIKCALDLLGYFGGDPLPPLRAVNEEARASIRRILEEGGLL